MVKVLVNTVSSYPDGQKKDVGGHGNKMKGLWPASSNNGRITVAERRPEIQPQNDQGVAKHQQLLGHLALHEDSSGLRHRLSSTLCRLHEQTEPQALKEAKRAELEAKLVHPTDLLRNISRAEMARHCKRTTRSSSEMETLISELIEAYSGHRGCNSLGVPLINLERMAEIWKAQKKHLSCLQDPPGVLLYMETGTIKEGGHVLETYRRARGSTSLECFHLHMNRFIPGTLASDIFLQAYLLDGLARWNEDRSMSAEGRSEPPVPQEPPSRLASP
nr:uncharacterized protein LOC107392956 [Nothobranchius furzeri]